MVNKEGDQLCFNIVVVACRMSFLSFCKTYVSNITRCLTRLSRLEFLAVTSSERQVHPL